MTDTGTADRERSFWAWGYADRLPTEDDRRDLKARVENQLGFPERPLLDMPTLDDVTLPDARVEVPDEFSDICTQSKRARVHHTYGKAYPDLVRGFHCEYDDPPDIVATPREEEDIETLLAWASEERIAVVPFGGGTSVVRGVECSGEGYAGVVSLDMRQFDQVLDVDRTSRAARIQAGATGPEIQEQLAASDLQLRHYPQSYEFSTFGGWIATRAGGHFATRYTHIDDFIESVRAVTPAGALETWQLPASGAGPDPNRFLLGSEGAFGVITEGWARVQPRPPYRSRATVHFTDFWNAVTATREIVQSRLTPANCRLLDRNEALLNEVALDGSHVLLLGFESTAHPTDKDLERALGICEDHGGSCPNEPRHEQPNEKEVGEEKREEKEEEKQKESEEGSWRASFLDAPYQFNALVSVGVLVDTFETAVTWDQFPDLHASLKERVTAAMREECDNGFLACRFTHVYEDGPAPYYTLLAPADVGRELDQWRAIKRAASDVLSEHGATITHHHAVGRVHREHYQREVPDLYLQALRSMKHTLDPEGIMNPGVLVGE
jgi:alkyldihydroxyacetonephosphate synthase